MSHKSAKHITLGVLVTTLLLVTPVQAVKNFKISGYGGGHQIWFEAEEFDERNPESEQYFPVVDEAGAFGQAGGRRRRQDSLDVRYQRRRRHGRHLVFLGTSNKSDKSVGLDDCRGRPG